MNQNYQTRLEETLKSVMIFTANQYGGFAGFEAEDDEKIAESQQQITELFLELLVDKTPEQDSWHTANNQLRAELRSQVKGDTNQ